MLKNMANSQKVLVLNGGLTTDVGDLLIELVNDLVARDDVIVCLDSLLSQNLENLLSNLVIVADLTNQSVLATAVESVDIVYCLVDAQVLGMFPEKISVAVRKSTVSDIIFAGVKGPVWFYERYQSDQGGFCFHTALLSRAPHQRTLTISN